VAVMFPLARMPPQVDRRLPAMAPLPTLPPEPMAIVVVVAVAAVVVVVVVVAVAVVVVVAVAVVVVVVVAAVVVVVVAVMVMVEEERTVAHQARRECGNCGMASISKGGSCRLMCTSKASSR
jgi:hypothetical protein